MNHLLHWRVAHQHRLHRCRERFLQHRIEPITGDTQRLGEARAGRENIANYRHGAAGDILEQYRRTAVAQGQHRAEFEPRIDRPRNAMQRTAAVEAGEKTAHALIGHRRSRPLTTANGSD